ncbi:MAG: hypothetical protein K6G76_10665 [Lachnospiraceae bacterium]|nr:hypothetical protein [Lachnospiraceae bacterium]
MSGNKTKYTFNASVSGNAVGKNIIVKACSYNNKQGIGMGPYSKGKKAKINK